MRDLLFKNLTSAAKKRKIITSTEVVENNGVRSIIHRHFVYVVKEISDATAEDPIPCLYIIKEHNHKEQRERFFCKMKGSLCAFNQGTLYSIRYLHSLSVNLVSVTENITP